MNNFSIYVTVSRIFHLNIQFSSLDYTISKFPTRIEYQEIGKRWNCDNFNFVFDIKVSVLFSYLLSIDIYISRSGFSVGEWLTKKFYNDEKGHEKLPLSIDRNNTPSYFVRLCYRFVVHAISCEFHFCE